METKRVDGPLCRFVLHPSMNPEYAAEIRPHIAHHGDAGDG